jgi:hypothetical protein
MKSLAKLGIAVAVLALLGIGCQKTIHEAATSSDSPTLASAGR